MTVLSDILSSRIRAEIFRLLFGVKAEELYMRELERRSGFSIGAIQTELNKLVRLELVHKRKNGNRVYVSANQEHPLFPDIKSLVLKTSGLADVLREALHASEEIQIAFVFGSVARRGEKAGSDIDLLVLGDVTLRQLTGLLDGVATRISREINPHAMKRDEFVLRRSGSDPYVARILEEPKIFIIGDESDLAAMV